jgi:hypothetical protein
MQYYLYNKFVFTTNSGVKMLNFVSYMQKMQLKVLCMFIFNSKKKMYDIEKKSRINRGSLAPVAHTCNPNYMGG